MPKGVRRATALEEANDFTLRSKVAKVYVLPKRGVTIAAELFVNDPANLVWYSRAWCG